MLSYLQLGALPAAIAQYEPAVVRAVNPVDFAGAAQAQYSSLRASQPQVQAVKPAKGGTIVVVALAPQGERRDSYAFTVRRTNGEWLIVYDALMDDAINTYTTLRTQARLAPGASRTAPQAQAAGTRESSAFRVAGLRGR
jgi:hypothetical protein